MIRSDAVISLYRCLRIIRQNRKRLISFLVSALVVLSSFVHSPAVISLFSVAETPQNVTKITIKVPKPPGESTDSIIPSLQNSDFSRANTDEIDKLSDFKDSGIPISEIDIPSSLQVDENGIPINYQYCVEAKATAYTGDTATASGRTPMPGHIAVNPKEYPYGTELYVVSADGDYIYGYCIAADTGGFVKAGNTDIDVYLDNEDMCYDWGNKDVIIYIL